MQISIGEGVVNCCKTLAHCMSRGVFFIVATSTIMKISAKLLCKVRHE
uniref:Uncharacterized protein n=1 Tax=Anopheles minimus TaxID=112268 RepID=A0A182WQB5_9DIPT